MRSTTPIGNRRALSSRCCSTRDISGPKPAQNRRWKPSPWVQISQDAPPTFLIHAMNDPTDNVRHSLAYGLALNDVGVPVEMHL